LDENVEMFAAFVMCDTITFARTGLFPYEFYNTINANGNIRDFINKNIGRMHIFQTKTLSYVIYSLSIIIVSESFCSNHFIYFPVCWACLACCSITTCFKACSRVVAYDVRPDEHLTCKAEACMLRLIELSKVCFSIEYIVYIVIHQMKRMFRKLRTANRLNYLFQTYRHIIVHWLLHHIS